MWGGERERERRREDRLMDRYVSFVTKRVSGTSRTVIERKWTELAYELAYFLPMVQYSREYANEVAIVCSCVV